ncbi:MAG: hypothetical protein GY851_22830 [bacterium]|nr:hypothetical protein [bacterium]
MAGIATGCATGAHGPRARGVNVIAHRGASAYAPENTMAAFRLAAEMEADWYELDCTLTKDGEVLVIHDGSIDRTTPGKGAVAALTLAEVNQLDAGSWKDPKFSEERLPTLAEALDFAKGTIGVYIEIKDSHNDGELKAAILDMAADAQTLSPSLRKEMMALIEASGTRNLELTRKTIQAVRERKMKKEIVIQSFSPIVCAITSSEAPELRVEYLSGSHKDNPAGWEEALRWAYLLDVDGFNCAADAINPGRLAMFHAAGKTMAAWTVDATPEMRRLAGWGVDAIITNRPDACLAELKEHGYR